MQIALANLRKAENKKETTEEESEAVGACRFHANLRISTVRFNISATSIL